MEYLMTSVIASRKILQKEQSGRPNHVEVQIGTPIEIEGGDRATWYCPYQILGLGDDRVRTAFGSDAVQALYLALAIAGDVLSHSLQAEDSDSYEPNFGFPLLP